MTGVLEPRQASRFRFQRVDREIIESATAGMGNVVAATPDSAACVCIVQIEGEWRVRRN